MENDRSDGPGGVRLPEFDAHAAVRPGYAWPAQPYWPPGYPPPYGARYTRRVSNWTAAALIAGVAATTGYLAHAIPGASSKSAALTHRHHKARKAIVYAPAAPYVPPAQAPVVTSGGSGHGGGD